MRGEPAAKGSDLDHGRCLRTRGLLLALALAAFAACSIERDYAMLSFFFDGVPDPTAPAAVQPIGPAQRTGPLSLDERSSLQQQRLGTSKITFHAPFRDKQCASCHAIARSGDWLQGVPELVAPIEDLCGNCHEPPATKSVHAPVDARACFLCHQHHSSTWPHLLKTARSKELCQRCHTPELIVSREQHESYGDRDCTECHDPHGSDREMLRREPNEPITNCPVKATASTPSASPPPAHKED